MTSDPITTEEYFRGTLKVIAHWSEVDLSGEWETGLRGVIRSITDMARETLSAHPEKSATTEDDTLDQPQQYAGNVDALIAKWRAEASRHFGASNDDDCGAGTEEWCLHREANRIYSRCANELAALIPVEPQPTPDIAAGMTKAMEIVGEMRMSEAGIFDEKHSGQRGEDRSNALYDAYVAIRSALPRPESK